MLPEKGAIELIKLTSNSTSYYIKSDSEVTGFYYNPAATTPEAVSFTNKKLDEQFTFTTDLNQVTVMLILYSTINADNLSEQQGTLSRVVTSSERLLATAYNGTNLYFSENSMDDSFVSSVGLAWYYILLIALGALILLVLLILLCVFCCCKKDDEEVSVHSSQTSSQSYYQDTFAKPKVDKNSKSEVAYMTQKSSENSGFTNDL